MSSGLSWLILAWLYSLALGLLLLADLLILQPLQQWIVRLVNKHRRRS